ncbi:serine carboxypeptidase-like 51 isoform X1 [Amborella trichopoda]|uniref:serine carboxypeptidase-like 51 isoform X1 n=1 Tax=Amborella trichopoda TaxID=13333 RepID=UPI0005D3363E|nr:serine carboxypeptidase-like 51 isoform X1 [Amborella trichopoda]|eukprot:XP_011629329.1 serine carboxypeptidase-like 51 isoform X1 [Amborella trichopoda]
MGKREIGVVFGLILLQGVVQGYGTEDGSEEWGYVQVRPKAHLFWWLYHSPQRILNSSDPWPTILWLQGGPGASGVGLGNFKEIGPLDTSLQPRNSTWLQKADLLFVDSPVGTGFSFVEEDDLFVRTDEEAAIDLVTLLKKLYNNITALQSSPLFVVAESYGGKHAVTLGLALLKAIEAGELKLKLGGIALGNSWISPEDFVLSWGPLLLDVSRLGYRDAENSIRMALQIKEQIATRKYADATDSWINLEGFISGSSNEVDFYNFMEDSRNDPVAATISSSMNSRSMVSARRVSKYSRYLTSIKPDASAAQDIDMDTFMNQVIRKKLKIIPNSVQWGGQSDGVFVGLYNDFMKPRIQEVDELLTKGINVTIYNGQVDLICSTKGVQAWIQKLKWGGLEGFNKGERRALNCTGRGQNTMGFFKSYANLHFYWILGAGHFVPVEQPCVALDMVADITHSPVTS